MTEYEKQVGRTVRKLKQISAMGRRGRIGGVTLATFVSEEFLGIAFPNLPNPMMPVKFEVLHSEGRSIRQLVTLWRSGVPGYCGPFFDILYSYRSGENPKMSNSIGLTRLQLTQGLEVGAKVNWANLVDDAKIDDLKMVHRIANYIAEYGADLSV